MRKIVSFVFGLIITVAYGQDLKFSASQPCDEIMYFLRYGSAETIYLDGHLDSSSNLLIKSYKVNGKNFKIEKEPAVNGHVITPKSLGKSALKIKIKLTNGDKVIIRREFQVVELPDIKVEISVTSPDSKFMWLNILDKKTGIPINPDEYDICTLDFYLSDSLGNEKERGRYSTEDDFFPSVTLLELPSRFELKDQLRIFLSLVHKKYNLVINNDSQLITITKLWK